MYVEVPLEPFLKEGRLRNHVPSTTEKPLMRNRFVLVDLLVSHHLSD